MPTIFDRLEEAGHRWKFYVQNYDPAINLPQPSTSIPETARRRSSGCRSSTYDRFLDDPELNSHIVDLDEYFVDLERGTLPAVAYIAPVGRRASIHPGA